MQKIKVLLVALVLSIFSFGQTSTQPFQYLDVFDLQYVSDPQISPGGEWIVYRRMEFDIMNDRSRGNLWLVKPNGEAHRKLTSKETNESSARWSPDGQRIAFVGQTDEGAEIYIYWLASGNIARITQLPFSPSSIT